MAVNQNFRSFYGGEKIAFDQFDNIVLVDPNKIINSDGQQVERLVEHENLVMYANLEARIIPRTKLAVGENTDQMSRNVKIANFGETEDGKINFLKPQGKKYLDTTYTDQLTGEGSLNGVAINQTQITEQGSVVNNAQDTQLLGITSINIKNNASFIPQVDIEMVDVQGRTLFELGENSPYSAFFQLPYPLFYLTVKGFYGKAVRYELMMKSFNARFDPTDGNYKVSISFIGRTAAILSDLSLGALFALPHMYETNLLVDNNEDPSDYNGDSTTLNNQLSSETEQAVGRGDDEVSTSPIIVTRGQKVINDVYSTYVSKGLIDPKLPRLNLSELNSRLKGLEDFIRQQFSKEDLSVLNDIETYGGVIKNYRDYITTFRTTRWPYEYLDTTKRFIDNEGGIYYGLKKTDDSLQDQEDARSVLVAKINEFNQKLLDNSTFGEDGEYTILGKKKSSSIPVNIGVEDLEFDLTFDDVNLTKSYQVQKNATPNEVDLAGYELEVKTYFELQNTYYNLDLTPDEELSSKFYGFGQISDSNKTITGSFLKKIDKIEKIYKDKAETIQKELSTALAQKIENPDGGLGFRPTIRNVMAILMANVDAFYRLMDEVHTDAYNVKDDPIRQNVIVSEQTTNGVDSKDTILSTTNNEKIVYPWPQYFEKELDEDGNERYVVKYLGDPKVESSTKSYLYDKWPEVEFIEEFIKGKLQRRVEQKSANFGNNKTELPAIPVNPVEFPYDNIPYTNLSEVPFLYEIWERTFLSSNYSKLFRANQSPKNLYQIVADFETETIKKAIDSDPFLKMKLKRMGINSSNFESILSHVSNNGTGKSWNTFLADVFVTPYIREYDEKFFELYTIETFQEGSPTIDISVESETKLKEYLESPETDDTTFTDVYPLSNLSWLQSNVARGKELGSVDQANITRNSLYFSTDKKTVVSFDESKIGTSTSFANTPSMVTNWYNNPGNTIDVPSYSNLKVEFERRQDKKDYFVTEGAIDYGNDYSGFTSRYQTTSLLNTPYFINSINKSVTDRKNGVDNPYSSMGYLFLNSLPLQTLREKMNKGKGNPKGEFNDYNFAIYNKFGALHKMPYAWVVKYGSIWYRYKKYINEGIDILDDVWTNVDQNSLYDPRFDLKETLYKLPKYGNSGTTDYQMEKDFTDPLSILNDSKVDVGFYPQLVNDINYLFNYEEFLTGYTSTDFETYYSGGTSLGGDGLKVATNSSSRINFPSGNVNLDPIRQYTINSFYAFYDKPQMYDGDFKDRVLCYPSAGGGDFNQFQFEVTNTNGRVVGNPLGQPLYDGSIKTLWGGSHYGYFDTSLIKKPTYRQYIKTIDNEFTNQDTFNLQSVSEYSSIEEILAVFNSDIMDLFEKEFLDFCKDPNRESNGGKDNPNLITSMKNLFFVERPNLTGNADLDGKIIADQQLKSFKQQMINFVTKSYIFKHGNPSNFNRRVWLSFTDDSRYQTQNQRIDFGTYIPGSLPTLTNSTTLGISEGSYPEAWTALRLVVGEYDANGMEYSDSGSFITDFFVDMDIEFNESNVRQLGPIIQIYASQKFENPTMTSSEFMSLYNEYLTLLDSSQKKIQNNLFTKLNKDLPVITEETENIKSSMTGEVAKLELYEFFKALNDKWIAGGDFENRTLFEDFLFLDRANRDIGNKLIVDVTSLVGYINDETNGNSIYTLIGHLIQKNNMLFMALPAYTNFYGVSDPSPNARPEDGIESSASDVFGTFLEVDHNKSRPRFLCLYTDKVSEHLNQSENVDYRFGDDSFDIYKAEVLRENQTNKTDYAFSNKVVGFNVDFGVRNQGIFKSVSLDQSQFKDTSESFRILTDMANQSKGSKTFQQSTSLYNIYKNRSYNCQITSMGNVMIQPTMYFNLRYVPMFTGPYWITDVSHNITPGDFMTTFSGVRISKYSFPSVKELTMSVNIDLLRRLNEQYSKPKTTPVPDTPSPTPTPNPNSTLDSELNEVSSSLCTPLTRYEGLDYVPLRNETLSYIEIKNYVDSISISDGDVKRLIGLMPWIENTFQNGILSFRNGNVANLTTDTVLNGINSSDIEGQVCVNVGGQNRPLASFNDWKKGMEVVKTKLGTSSVLYDMSSQIGTEEYENDQEKLYAKIYIKYLYSQIPTDAEFDRIITNPSNDDEKRIRDRYNRVIPIFDSGIKWYETL